jgi:hypothetical protein
MRIATALAVAALSTVALADAGLPATLHGRWFGTGMGGNTNNFEISLADVAQAPDGKVTGKLTRFGNGCGAEGEPLTGTFDGTTLVFESTSKAGVHTRRMGGDCGVDQYKLTRAAEAKSFTGTMRDKQGNAFTIELAP